MTVKRGDIYYADLSPVVGSEQGGLRPVLIIQNDVGNKYSPTVIAAAITSRQGKTRLPTHIDVCRSETGYEGSVGLSRNSVVLLEQIRTLDKRRLKEKMGHLDDLAMKRVNDAISISFGLSESAGYASEDREAIPASLSFAPDSGEDENISVKQDEN
ncbi:MAG: type II toxin-antitoxin system PemK/MazF family toxin [Clostridia bacterium]|nr:type II toxin-antitoxin system PemK/MazF family toxin [Clostridia bacterium]